VPDVVHVHTTGPIGLAGFDLAARLAVPLVVTWHTDLVAYARHFIEIPLGAAYCARRLRLGWSPAQYRELTGHRRRERLLHLGRAMMARTALVIAPSAKTAAGLAAFGTLPPVRVLPTPACPPAGPGDPHALRSDLGVPPGAPVILAVGRTTPEKNPSLLIDAFAHVAHARPDAHLVVVGADRNRRVVRLRAAAHGLSDRVRLQRPVPHARLGAYYRMADLLAFASTSDTQSLVVAEAEAMGVPVVSVDPALAPDYRLTCAPVPEALAAGMMRMLDDPVLRERCARAGVRATAGYPPARFLDGLLDAYRSTM
jgi:glycosyltransferase involved in cell wall biosynthesis